MFVNYTVSNVLSFGHPVTLNLMEERRTSRHKDHVVESAGIRCLRGAVVYGPNASGKSNLVSSMLLLKRAIDADDCSVLDGNQFALGDTKSPVMSWEVAFTSSDDFFVFRFKTDGKVVVEESLRILEDDEIVLYERNRDGVRLGRLLSEDRWFDVKVRASSFYLRKVVSDGLYERKKDTRASQKLIAAIDALTSIEILPPDSNVKAESLARNLKVDDFRKFLVRLMQTADVGITDIKWVPIPPHSRIAEMAKYYLSEKALETDGVKFFRTRGNFVAVIVRNRRPEFFELRFFHGRVPMRGVQESDGTIRMLEYSVFLYSLFTEEQTWVVDEIDRCLHPFLTRFVATEALSHPGCKSQIIMTTHDVTILTQDIWRTDEVWFTEKRPDGSTDLYSLYQFKPRFDVDLEKRYREGRWGAVPVIERMRYGREAQKKRA